MKTFLSLLRASLVLLVIMTVLCGMVYPLLVTAVAQIAFSDKSQGSLLTLDGKVIGSSLLGQQFTDNKYFWGRLSATTPPYNAAASSGSNLSPNNPKLLEAANARMADLQKADSKNKSRIPVDLVTASASGLDPHISLAAAQYQVGRVAKARHMNDEEVKAVLSAHADLPLFGFWGEAKVNVLELNMELDARQKPALKEKR